MKRKTKHQIIAGIIGAVIIGLIGFSYFAAYGANKCDISYVGGPTNPTQIGSCDCFCCKGIYGRGYESCGTFGLLTGLVVGAILGELIAHLMWGRIETNFKEALND